MWHKKVATLTLCPTEFCTKLLEIFLDFSIVRKQMRPQYQTLLLLLERSLEVYCYHEFADLFFFKSMYEENFALKHAFILPGF